MPIRLVIADDHLLVREGVRRLLETDPDIEVAELSELQVWGVATYCLHHLRRR